MTTSVSIDARTEAIPRVPAAVLAVPGAQAAAAAPNAPVADAGTNAENCAAESDAEVAAPEPDADVIREESVQHMYEAGLAKLDALQDRWTAAMAELRKAQVNDGPEEAAA